jgi:predicted acetyltransferase
MGEFFVVRAARREGVGHAAAMGVFQLYPGRWEIPFQEENPAAAVFWRRVATDAVGPGWTLESRPVPGKPHIPPDSWIMLTVG